MASRKQLSSPEAAPKKSFWKSPSGVATGAAIGLGTVGLVMAMAKKKPSTPTPALPPASITGPVASTGTNATTGQTTYTNFGAGHYVFNVTAAINPTAWLNAAGFDPTQTLVERDPFATNNWLVTGYWTGSATTITDGGPSTWVFNGIPLFDASAPPTPQQINGLVAPNWYTFSIRTAFFATQVGAASQVAKILNDAGWGSSLVTQAVPPAGSPPDPTPDTWNVAAAWAQGAGTTHDHPPLWVFVPGFTPKIASSSTSVPPVPGTSMP